MCTLYVYMYTQCVYIHDTTTHLKDRNQCRWGLARWNDLPSACHEVFRTFEENE